MKQAIIRRTLLAVLLSTFGAGTMAQEVELNDSINLANELKPDATGRVSVTGAIGRGDGVKRLDIDFYKFVGQAGQTLTIDISNAHKGGASTALILNSYLTLFGPEPDYPLLRENDDSSCDTGSACVTGNTAITRDARIDNVTLLKDGTYYVAVTPAGVQFRTYNTFVTKMPNSNGPYTLTLSGLVPQAILMNIEIKPGGNHEANPKSKGTVPVVLRASKDFDPFKIDVSSLRFGVKGDEQSLRRCNDNPLGGSPDRLCHFDNEVAMKDWVPGVVEATLKGRTTDQKAFEGTAPIKVTAQPQND